MPLHNPPVVEVGIEFQLDPAPEKQRWDLPVAMPFVERFKETMPHVEVVKSEKIRIEKRSPQGVPIELRGEINLNQVRAHDEGERQWLEVGEDRVAYRLLRGGKEYPGFDVVLESTLSVLRQYNQHFRPMAVRRAILTYMDIVKIPRAPGEGIDLDDYFRLGVRLPDDPFGALGAFAIRFVLPPSPYSDRLQLAFSTEPGTEEESLRFRMRWQSLCDGINTLDEEELRNRLTAAQSHLVKCFLACFTERGLALFDTTGS